MIHRRFAALRHGIGEDLGVDGQPTASQAFRSYAMAFVTFGGMGALAGSQFGWHGAAIGVAAGGALALFVILNGGIR